jgi:phosphoribosylformylglycinamidine synthase
MDGFELPVRHGEGKFHADTAIINRLEENHQIALRYCLPDGTPANGVFPHNPNGSVQDIAGICDPTGRIFGLMPHPEAYHHFTNHPDWTRIQETNRRNGVTTAPGVTPGIRILENAVNFIKGDR